MLHRRYRKNARACRYTRSLHRYHFHVFTAFTGGWRGNRGRVQMRAKRIPSPSRSLLADMLLIFLLF